MLKSCRSAWERSSCCKNVKERIMDGIANQFPATNAVGWRILHIQSQKFSGGNTPGPPQREGTTQSQSLAAVCAPSQPLGVEWWRVRIPAALAKTAKTFHNCLAFCFGWNKTVLFQFCCSFVLVSFQSWCVWTVCQWSYGARLQNYASSSESKRTYTYWNGGYIEDAVNLCRV